MTLEIKIIREPGALEKERIVLEAQSAVDIGNYAIFQTISDGVNVFADVRNVFWLPDEIINPKDLVIIYTKLGSSRIKENSNGTKSRFYYWGLSNPLWLKGETAAVVVNIASWSAMHP